MQGPHRDKKPNTFIQTPKTSSQRVKLNKPFIFDLSADSHQTEAVFNLIFKLKEAKHYELKEAKTSITPKKLYEKQVFVWMSDSIVFLGKKLENNISKIVCKVQTLQRAEGYILNELNIFMNGSVSTKIEKINNTK